MRVNDELSFFSHPVILLGWSSGGAIFLVVVVVFSGRGEEIDRCTRDNEGVDVDDDRVGERSIDPAPFGYTDLRDFLGGFLYIGQSE